MTNRRKHISMQVQRDVALAQLGALMRKLGMVQVERPIDWQLDHDPALILRPMNEDGTDTVPPASDPGYLVWLTKEAHRDKTTGRKGTSNLSISGNGDVSRGRKCDRVAKKQAAFCAKLLAKQTGEEPPPASRQRRKQKIKSRGFQGSGKFPSRTGEVIGRRRP